MQVKNLQKNSPPVVISLFSKQGESTNFAIYHSKPFRRYL